MEPKRKPEVVDLESYKRARLTQAEPKPAPAPVDEPFLGARPRAGLILALVIAVMAALWLTTALR